MAETNATKRTTRRGRKFSSERGEEECQRKGEDVLRTRCLPRFLSLRRENEKRFGQRVERKRQREEEATKGLNEPHILDKRLESQHKSLENGRENVRVTFSMESVLETVQREE